MTQAYNLAILANAVNTSGQLNVGTNATGTLPVANGGTGTSSPSLVAGSGITISGSFPNQTIASSASGQGGRGQAFTSNGTFTIPTGITALKVTVLGGGAGGRSQSVAGQGANGGGAGGCAVSFLTGLTAGNTLAVTVGSGGGGNASGGNSTVASGTQTITTITGGGAPNQNGGTATNGTFNIKGGSAGFILYSSVSAGSVLGGSVGPNTAAGLYGSGGGGGLNDCNSIFGGQAGSQGIVIFEW